MYKRYAPMPNRKPQAQNIPSGRNGIPERKDQQRKPQPHHPEPQKPHTSQNTESVKQPRKEEPGKSGVSNILTKFIPQSVYNPETGKILGFLSAEDLLIVAIILLLIDNDSESGEDNTMLIFALLYILISDHIDLPI